MPSLHQIALMFVRVVAGMNIVGGALLIPGSFVAAIFSVKMPALQGIPFTLLSYGLVYLIVGIGLLLFGTWIAKFASKGQVS